jgi:trigger factor
MNIVKESKDALNITLDLKIEKADYEERVMNLLKDYRRKAQIHGFRPGQVPMGMIQKMYGKHVLLDELNKIVSENLSKFIVDEKLHVLGDPLPNEEKHRPIDLDNQSEFEFAFDIALAPEIDVKLEGMTFPYYTIKPDSTIIDDQISRYASRYSNVKPIDEVIEKAMLKGYLAQLDDKGNILEGGILKENATISPTVIRDEDIKKQFIGSKKGTSVDFSIKEAFPSDTEISSMLAIKKTEAEQLDSNFRYTITEISEFIPHEINQELFDKVYGEGTVTSEEEFKNKVKAEIEVFYTRESNFKFLLDAKEELLKSLAFELPDAFLKRWLVTINKELTPEKVENEYPVFVNDMKWQLVKSKIANTHQIKVEEEELLSFAKESVLLQFQQYGLMTVPDDYLTNYAKESLKKEEERNRLFEKKLEDKILEHIRTVAKMDIHDVTHDEFNNLFKEHDHEHEGHDHEGHDHEHEH